MNPHSLRFRLLAWFGGLLVLVVVAFGVYTYSRIEAFVVEVQRAAMAHRAEQIAAMLIDATPEGEARAGARIEARFAPELNDKFVRVTRVDGSVLFVSGPPNDRSFDPTAVPPVRHGGGTRVSTTQGADLLLEARTAGVAEKSWLVEVGVSLGGSNRLLHTLALTLLAGLPVVLCLALAGGYVLIGLALRPVQQMMSGAQDITLHHLGRRLPVPQGGDEIAGLAVALNQMVARLEEAYRNSSRFTADASHELRTPLTIVRGELEALLLSGALSGRAQDEVASVLEEIERLVRIVEGLFALSRLDAGEAQAERVRLDLAALAETTAEQMCLLAEEKRISLRCAIRGRVEVEGDRSRLKQVIVNLLDNAIKYTPAGGQVTLAVRLQEGGACLTVEDDGPGAPLAALPHLFGRFYRADEARSREIDGAGLGLSIVESVCTAHGGSVAVRNLSPSGFEAAISLPAALARSPLPS